MYYAYNIVIQKCIVLTVETFPERITCYHSLGVCTSVCSTPCFVEIYSDRCLILNSNLIQIQSESPQMHTFKGYSITECTTPPLSLGPHSTKYNIILEAIFTEAGISLKY